MSATDEQLTALLQYCGDFARLMIEDSGEFYPFGAEIDAMGELRALGFADGTERPSPQELYEYAQSVLSAKARSGQIIAGAIAVNVNIPPQFESLLPDGIRVHVEASNFSRFIYQPYSIQKSGFLGRKRVVEYAEMIGVDVGPVMFGDA
jgi:hypothetical protein